MGKIINTALILLILGTFSLQAQMHHGKKFDGELKSKLQEYNKENVCPQWMVWKNKIDNSLSKEDLQKLNVIRTEVAKLIAEKKECIENCRKNSFKPDFKNNDSDKADGKRPEKGMNNFRKDCFESCGLKDAKDKYTTELKEILNGYSNLIKEILKEAKPLQEKWSNDRAEIIKDYNKNMPEDTNSLHHKMFKDRQKFERKPENGKRFIGMLVLWNGSCEAEPEDLINIGNLNVKDGQSVNVTTTPNPFTEKVTISFNLEKNAQVKLTVTGTNGTEAGKLFEGMLSAGEHSYIFKAGNLTPGAYLYNLTIDGKVSTGKIILNK